MAAINIQTELTITDQEVTIRHLLWGEDIVPLDSIVSVQEGRYKSSKTLAIVTTTGEGHRIAAHGGPRQEIGEVVARRLGMVFDTDNGLMRWVRP